MRLIPASVLLLSLAAILPACTKTTPPAEAAKPAEAALATEDDKTLYAVGQVISRNLEQFQLSPQELKIVLSGIEDGVNGKTDKVDITQYGEKIQTLLQTRATAMADKQKAAGAEYLAKAANEQGATKTASGLVISTITPGTGSAPKETDQVKVHYEGKLVDGTVFDSSLQRGEPATFPLNGVIPCWTEALQLMKVGGKSRVVCPSDIAYGERGAPPKIGPGATLVFEVQLLDIVKPETK
jgi:FKBP-type peptidyl-prolyl cis-trans isomerase FkpA